MLGRSLAATSSGELGSVDQLLDGLTPRGALMAGYPANYAPRSVAPTTWAHASACAWVSAWLELRGRTWSGERELLHDDAWRYQLTYEDHRGTARGTHHPDLGVFINPGPVAIEVELQRKSAARMRGICNMYARLTDEPDALLAGVIYVINRPDVAATINRFAWHVGLASPAIASARLTWSSSRHGQPPTNSVRGGRRWASTSRAHSDSPSRSLADHGPTACPRPGRARPAGSGRERCPYRVLRGGG